MQDQFGGRITNERTVQEAAMTLEQKKGVYSQSRRNSTDDRPDSTLNGRG
jgi:hypothetical protein